MSDVTTASSSAIETKAVPVTKKATYSVMVSFPTYGGHMKSEILMTTMNATRRGDIAYAVQISDTSANCMGMNQLLVNALDARDRGEITHFFMHHTDIVPEYWWLDKMMGLMEKHGADVLCAVSPIKDHQGFTSTALDEQVGTIDQHWRVRRLTMKEIYKREPTFTDPKLLLNDGFMLVDLRKPWVDKVLFKFEDAILLHNGKRVPVIAPEDWGFSRQAAALGAKLYATRELSLNHYGLMAFPNTHPWGTAETDAVAHCPGVPDALLTAVDRIEGWFTLEEASSLYLHAKEAFKTYHNAVEVGSYKGRSTLALARAAKDSTPTEGVVMRYVHAVDPHEGTLYADGSAIKMTPSLEDFTANMLRAGVSDHVKACVQKSTQVEWSGEPIGLLFLDGLHDYENVAADFEHFIKWVPEGGYVCFHDYAESDPDVMRFVDEEIGLGSIEKVTQVDSLLVCKVPKGINVPQGPGYGV